MTPFLEDLYRQKMQRLHEWRQRYNPQEYPLKVAQNLLYEALTIEKMWHELKKSFQTTDVKGKRQLFKSFDEAHNYIFVRRRQIQTEEIRPLVVTTYSRTDTIPQLNFGVFRQRVLEAQGGNLESIEEVEFTYFFHTAAYEMIYAWSAAGLMGYDQQKAYNYITPAIFNGLDYKSLDLMISAFGQTASRVYSRSPHNPGEKNYKSPQKDSTIEEVKIGDQIHKSPEEVELQQKEELLLRKQDELAELELLLSTLEGQLKSFEVEYYLKVGSKYVQLDQLQATLDKILAAKMPLDDTAQKRAAESQTKAEQSAQDAEGFSYDEDDRHRPEATPELKSLYREAAKLVHPDLTLDPDEKERRHHLMQQINEAYQRGDIESLHQIFDAEKNNPELIKGDDIGSALVRVIRKIAQVDKRISDIETAISDLQSTDLFHLFEAVEKETEKGIDLLDKMANELLSRISFLEQQMEKHHV